MEFPQRMLGLEDRYVPEDVVSSDDRGHQAAPIHSVLGERREYDGALLLRDHSEVAAYHRIVQDLPGGTAQHDGLPAMRVAVLSGRRAGYEMKELIRHDYRIAEQRGESCRKRGHPSAFQHHGYQLAVYCADLSIHRFSRGQALRPNPACPPMPSRATAIRRSGLYRQPENVSTRCAGHEIGCRKRNHAPD